VCSVYNQPYYKGWYSLGVVYRDLPQHHHNLMDKVPGRLSAEVRYVTILSRCLNCSVTPDTILSLAFTVKFPDRLWGFQEVEAPRFQDSRHIKEVRLSAASTGHLYPQKVFLVLISVIGWFDPRAKVRPEGLYQWKITMTPSRIEPATFRFVAWCLNQLRYDVPPAFFVNWFIALRYTNVYMNFY
jgi:hypothetical protein